MSSEDPDNPALCIPYIVYRQNLFWKKQRIIAQDKYIDDAFEVISRQLFRIGANADCRK